MPEPSPERHFTRNPETCQVAVLLGFFDRTATKPASLCMFLGSGHKIAAGGLFFLARAKVFPCVADSGGVTCVCRRLLAAMKTARSPSKTGAESSQGWRGSERNTNAGR